MANRRYTPRSFGLLFAAGELLPSKPDVSHFIQGTVYLEEGQAAHNASGRAESRYESQPAAAIEYDNLSDLATQLGLDQGGVNAMVARITATVSKP